MSNDVAQQQYKEFYWKLRDLKIASYKLCDRKLESLEDYAYLTSHYSNSSVKFGTDKIYVTYRYPIKEYKIGFHFPAELVYKEQVEDYEIDEMEIHIFNMNKKK